MFDCQLADYKVLKVITDVVKELTEEVSVYVDEENLGDESVEEDAVDQVNNKQVLDEIEGLRNQVNDLFPCVQRMEQIIKENNDRLNNQVLEMQVSLQNHQKLVEKLLQEKNSTQQSNSNNNQSCGFQQFEASKNTQQVNLREFRYLLNKGEVNNVILNLSRSDFNKNRIIYLKVSKQQVIQGLTINNTNLKQWNIIVFQVDSSITFENCDFKQVEIKITCSKGSKLRKIAPQVDLKNVVCRNTITKHHFTGCLVISGASKVVATNLSLENKEGLCGLRLSECSKVELNRISVDNCEKYGIGISSCGDVDIMDLSCTNCGETGCDFFIISRVKMLNCNISKCKTGIKLGACCSNAELNQISVEDCLENGIVFYFNKSNVSVTDSNFSNCGEHGCVWRSSRGQMLNCDVWKCKTGIYLDESKVYKDHRCQFALNQRDFQSGPNSEWLIEG
eukprot:TRINITY_DN28474_c1_g4_i2.p1 TRINITY_DN28474_c1_g4~~TRINITY_DN28474_c1_g4_i2.p1  ORF type:complete len:480 (-),score=44.60 TRINITY_DN28474_c1_g4_i2:201-1547(-)